MSLEKAVERLAHHRIALCLRWEGLADLGALSAYHREDRALTVVLDPASTSLADRLILELGYLFQGDYDK